MTSVKLFLRVVAIAGGLYMLAGCATVGVNVWQRDILAGPEMQFDAQASDRDIDDHVYFSKEASSGGRGFGGGGCGCN